REVDPAREPADHPFERLVLEGDHLATALADDVMVVLAARQRRLVAGGVLADVEALDEPLLLQKLERPVDAGHADAVAAALEPVVCFHGEPTWAFLYRKMVPVLSDGGHRVVCPDYAGFGRSDKPTDRRWYSYDRHVELVSALLGSLDLREATVVVQDWGGPIG